MPGDGTVMARDRSVQQPDAVWRTQRDRFFLNEARGTTRLMVAAGVLFQGSIIAMFVGAGYPGWRIGAMGGIYAAFIAGHRLIIGRAREPQCVESSFIAMNVAAQLYVVGTAALTGGVHSPFVPSTVLPAIVSLLFFGPQAVSRWIALGNALLIIAMVALPGDIVGPALPHAHYGVAIMIALSWNVFMLHMLVGKLSVVASRTGESMQCLREERLSD